CQCLDTRQTLRLDGAPCPGGGQCKGGRCTCSILGDTANCPSGEICDHDGSGGHACYPKCRVGYVGDCGRGTACGPVFDVSDNFVGGRCAARTELIAACQSCSSNVDCAPDRACIDRHCRPFCDTGNQFFCTQATGGPGSSCVAVNGALGYCAMQCG